MRQFYAFNKIKISLLSMMVFAIPPALTYAQSASDVDTVKVVAGFSILAIDEYGNPLSDVVMKNAAGDSISSTNKKGVIRLEDKPSSGWYAFDKEGFYHNQTKINFDNNNTDIFTVNLSAKVIKKPKSMNVLYGEADPNLSLGSSATVYREQINSTLAPTYAHALPGRLAGLYTQQYAGMRNPLTNGNSNADLIGNIPVYGQGSPNDNQQFILRARGQNPVTVIDGVQRDLFSLDPENIESVSIQKDALSSILLGMRSSRGVLLVTTRRPHSDEFRLSFTGERGIQTLMNIPKPLPAYQYAYMLNEALQYDGKVPAYTQADFQALANGSKPFVLPNVNWYDEILKKQAPISTYNLNVSGGGKAARYYVGLNYMDQEGHFITSDENSYNTNLGQERYLINSSIDVDVTNDFAVNATIFGRIEEGSQPGAGAYNILNALYQTPNIAYPIYNPNGTYGGTSSFPTNLMAQTINSGYILDNSRDAMVNIELKYDFSQFIDGLTLKGMSNVSTQSKSAIFRNKRSIVYQFKPDTLSSDLNGGTYTSYGQNDPQANNFVSVYNYKSWYGQLNLTYEKAFENNNVTATLFADQQVNSINYDLPRKPVNVATSFKYNYKQKYMVEAAVVYSKYNFYKPGNQEGVFYAFGLGWDLAKEEFLSSATWLDQLKLRSVYGRTGNGIDNAGYFTWRQSFRESVTDYTYLQGYSNTNQNATLESSPLANPNVGWEKADKFNIGTDITLFEGKVQFTGDYYYDNYFDLLQQRGKTIALGGFSYPFENIGEARFSGIEASLTYQNNIGNFNYYVTANWATNDSEVKYMDEQYVAEEYRRRTGKPVGTQFGYVADGFFTSTYEIENSPVIEGFNLQPGDLKYVDLNKDGIINEFDQKAIANTKPLSFYGATAGFNVAGFDFSVLIQGAYNRDLYVANSTLQAGFQGFGQSYGQAYTNLIDRWTPETAASAAYPRLTAGGNSYNLNPGVASSSFWVKPGDYLRIKNVSLGYTIPPAASRKFMDAQVRIFANATNLFTFSKYNLIDPEVVDFTSYPNLRVISGGINIKF